MNPGRVVTFGEVMLRLSTPGYARMIQTHAFNATYAGAEANVAVSLSMCGVPAAHVTRFPDNALGEAATQTLRKHGVDTRFIHYGPERMGLYFLENGAMQRASRIVYDRFDSAFAHIRPGSVDWDRALEGASWFHWTGITPAISETAAEVCREALAAAKKYDVRVSGDINYRRNLWQYGKSAREVMPALIEECDVVIAGITDMENCAGISGSSFEEACVRFQERFPRVKKIATTERTSVSSSHNVISAVLWNGDLLRAKEYDLTHIVDRIGAGDAFMAGLIYGWVTEMSDAETVEFATAACALKHTVEGDVNLVTAPEIEGLMKGENIGRLLR